LASSGTGERADEEDEDDDNDEFGKEENAATDVDVNVDSLAATDVIHMFCD
jgi:hypothetical protein